MKKKDRSEYSKKYYEANKEKAANYYKVYNKVNKERMSLQRKGYIDSKKHEPVVYYLPEHHYVGVTDCLYTRLKNHRNNSKRIVKGYEIIYTAKDMTEARAVERYMHYEMGYNGRHKGTKGY